MRIQAIKSCYKELQYYKAKPKEYVIRQDEMGYTYYIILEGDVEVYINIEMKRKFW
jgi:CRP-like cAMP-binding protein